MRTSPRSYIPCDHAHAVCQGSHPKSFIYTSSSCNVCLHEGSPVDIRASDSSFSKVESSIVEKFGRWEPSRPAEGRFAEAPAFDGWESGKTSTKSFSGRRVKEASGFDGACTASFAAAVDAASCLPGSRLQTEDVPGSELCSTSYCLPIGSASTYLTSSEAVDAPQSLSPAIAASSQTRSKVVRTAWEALVRWSRSWQLLNARKATNVLQKTKKVIFGI
ncbi:hypothetical protein GOP47_0007386 [Adiantum capillus-veneris]|uniref:Uncharacterized protein n=1 Tax=Adiantum capillus-veneris TaxID=13818 RepID=A0A9D4V217_ADICA|nr:hypothetical protein GOP47_0007386 [Adiantum capillus-veneris]